MSERASERAGYFFELSSPDAGEEGRRRVMARKIGQKRSFKLVWIGNCLVWGVSLIKVRKGPSEDS